jgi:hypothetical protein
MAYSKKFGCTAEQYHAGLDILWKALGNPRPNNDTVYKRISDRIQELERALRAIRARQDGVWDSPDLLSYGALGTMYSDIMYIIRKALSKEESGGS